MTIPVLAINEEQAKLVCSIVEGHFADAKSCQIQPSKLSNTLSAFANADGGELYIGLDEDASAFTWNGFTNVEAANGHIQALEQVFPIGEYFEATFLSCSSHPGLVRKFEIRKTADIRKAHDGKVYLRRGAQNLPQQTPEALRRLEFNKGISSFENEIVSDDVSNISGSITSKHFMTCIVPEAKPRDWLRKQRLIRGGKPTVAGEILFNDEPQIVLPKSSVKIYRYKTALPEGSRDTLAFTPLTIEGPAYKLIETAVAQTVTITEFIPVFGTLGFEAIKYPPEAIHEIVTNAIIHRDYSIQDDTHIRIFDNRIEIQSPGRLPGHVTIANILNERFARNPTIVRLLNKFPNAPNKDVGEGLNTAFDVMRNLKLKAPEIRQTEGSVVVLLWHEPLASYEEMVVSYLKENDEINNSRARQICRGESETRMKKLFERMVRAGTIERVPDKRGRAIAYRLKHQ